MWEKGYCFYLFLLAIIIQSFSPAISQHYGPPAVTAYGDTMWPVARIVGTATGPIDGLGRAHIYGGDVNGDGFSDLLCVQYGVGVYIFLGNSHVFPLDESASDADIIVLPPPSSTSSFGNASILSDVNGDGVDDLIISDCGICYHSVSPKGVWIFFGPLAPGTLSTADANVYIYYNPLILSSGFGYRMYSSDYNGDSINDILIGSPCSNNAFLFLGRTVWDDTLTQEDAYIKIIGHLDYFGASVSISDVNCDGKKDLIVENWAEAPGGKVYIFFNDSLLADTVYSGEADIKISGVPGEHFGAPNTGDLHCGDFNNDGNNEVLINDDAWRYGTEVLGAVYLVDLPIDTGSHSITGLRHLIFRGTSGINFHFGHVASYCDLNMDGISDLVVGDDMRDGSNIGHLYIFIGKDSVGDTIFSVDADIRILNEDTICFGWGANCIGDMDGDGNLEIAVGASMYDGNRGAVYIYEFSFPSDTCLPEGLVVYYPFNGNANDETGHGHDGVVHGATLIEDMCERADSAYWFDGVDDYIDCGNDSILWTPEVTVTCWIKANDLSRHSPTIITKSTKGLDGYAILTYDNHIQWEISNHGSWNSILSEPIDTGIWYFVTMTYKDGKLKGYINGVVVDSLTYLMDTPISEPLKIGHGYDTRGSWGTKGFNGSIDNVRIYNRALSPDEVLALYECERCEVDTIHWCMEWYADSMVLPEDAGWDLINPDGLSPTSWTDSSLVLDMMPDGSHTYGWGTISCFWSGDTNIVEWSVKVDDYRYGADDKPGVGIGAVNSDSIGFKIGFKDNVLVYYNDVGRHDIPFDTHRFYDYRLVFYQDSFWLYCEDTLVVADVGRPGCVGAGYVYKMFWGDGTYDADAHSEWKYIRYTCSDPSHCDTTSTCTTTVDSIWMTEETDCNDSNIVEICYTLSSTCEDSYFTVSARMSADSGATWDVPFTALLDTEGALGDSVTVGTHCFQWVMNEDTIAEGDEWMVEIEVTDFSATHLTPEWTLIDSIYLPFGDLQDLAFDGRYIWGCANPGVSYENNTFYAIDRCTRDVIAFFQYPFQGDLVGGYYDTAVQGLTFLNGYLWGGTHRGIVVKINRNTGECIDTFYITNPYGYGNSIDGIATDGINLYLCMGTMGPSGGYQIVKINPDSLSAPDTLRPLEVIGPVLPVTNGIELIDSVFYISKASEETTIPPPVAETVPY